jgi:hypothetical protein
MPRQFLFAIFAILFLLAGCNRREQAPAQQSLATYLSAPSDGKARSQRSMPPQGVAGGVPGGAYNADKKVVHNVQLALVVQNVADTSSRLRGITMKYQGEVDQIREWSPSEHTREGDLQLRIPSDRLESALAEFKSVAREVTNESVNATDVTRQFVDNAARMRSLQAEEQQYLTILKQAKSVEDVLAVTEKLNEVRTQIEELQAGINVMSHDVAMSAIAIQLSQNAPESGVLASWRPWKSSRESMRGMIESLGYWFDSAVSFLIYLPVILLWVLTVGVPVFVAWKLLRFYWRRQKGTA